MKNRTIACLRLAAEPDRITSVINKNFGPNITVNSISRTDIAGLSPLQAIRKLRTVPGDVFCIACKTLENRPRLSVLKAILLFSNRRQAYIIDEAGNIVSKSWVKFVFIETPKVLWELSVSLFVIFFWGILLYLLKLRVK